MSNFVSSSFLHIHLHSSSHVMALHNLRTINQMYINPGWPQRPNRQVESNIHPEILKNQEPTENILFYYAGNSHGLKKDPSDKLALEWHPSSDFSHTWKNCKIPGLEGWGSRQEAWDAWNALTFGVLWSNKTHDSPSAQERSEMCRACWTISILAVRVCGNNLCRQDATNSPILLPLV